MARVAARALVGGRGLGRGDGRGGRVWRLAGDWRVDADAGPVEVDVEGVGVGEVLAVGGAAIERANGGPLDYRAKAGGGGLAKIVFKAIDDSGDKSVTADELYAFLEHG